MTHTIECEIHSRTVAAGIEVTGVVRAPGTVRGDYSLAVVSQGSGGVSNVVQSGLFTAGPEAPAILGAVVVRSGAGTSFSARLAVHSEGGDCGAER